MPAAKRRRTDGGSADCDSESSSSSSAPSPRTVSAAIRRWPSARLRISRLPASVSSFRDLALDNSIVVPATTGSHLYSLIWLHGMGGSAEQQLPLARGWVRALPGLRVVLLRAPFRKRGSQDGFEWFRVADSDFFCCNAFRDPDTFYADRRELIPTGESDSFRILRERVTHEVLETGQGGVIVGGFSQGARMALTTLSHPLGLAGVVAVAPSALPDHDLSIARSQSPKIFCACGAENRDWESDGGKGGRYYDLTTQTRCVEVLQATGHVVEQMVDPDLTGSADGKLSGHLVSPRISSCAISWMRKTLSGHEPVRTRVQ